MSPTVHGDTRLAVSEGEIVDFFVIFDGGYAVWGQTPNDQIGVVHIFEWSDVRPIPDDAIPKIGDCLKVKVMRVVTCPQESLPADATCGGKVRIDFVGSIRLVGSSETWLKWYPSSS